MIPGYKLEFSASKFVFAQIIHTKAEVGIEPRPLAQESETLHLATVISDLKHINVYGHSNLFYKATQIKYDRNFQDRRWTATDAIEDGYSFSLFTDSYGSVQLKP